MLLEPIAHDCLLNTRGNAAILDTGRVFDSIRGSLFTYAYEDQVLDRRYALQGDDGRSTAESLFSDHGELFCRDHLHSQSANLILVRRDQIDEAHERSAYTDLLLGLLKK